MLYGVGVGSLAGDSSTFAPKYSRHVDKLRELTMQSLSISALAGLEFDFQAFASMRRSMVLTDLLLSRSQRVSLLTVSDATPPLVIFKLIRFGSLGRIFCDGHFWFVPSVNLMSQGSS